MRGSSWVVEDVSCAVPFGFLKEKLESSMALSSSFNSIEREICLKREGLGCAYLNLAR